MTRYRFKLIFCMFLWLGLINQGCVEPYMPDINKNDLVPQLVVEGQLTDETGPFKVRLTRSVSVYTFEKTNIVEPVTDADVRIFDDKGNAYHLNAVASGWYETDDKELKGVPGYSYTLQITDYDGTVYESTSELMPEVPAIDSVFYEGEERTSEVEGTVYKENWVNILLNSHSSPGMPDYFKWDFTETWEFEMPENIDVAVRGPGTECIVISGGFVMMKASVTIPPEQFHCWASETSRSILVKSTADNLPGKITRFPLTSIGPDDDRFSIRYSILVRQYALNKDLYIYFKNLKNLNETNGGIYDKLPAPVYGNIVTDTKDKKALGYFFASGVKTKRIFIDPSQVNIKTGHKAYSGCGYMMPPLCVLPYIKYGKITVGEMYVGNDVWSANKYCGDCRERGSDKKPDFW